MSRFTSRKEQTPAYEAAVRALRDLAASDGGWDAVQRASAEAIAGHREAGYPARYEKRTGGRFRPSGGRPDWLRLLGVRRRHHEHGQAPDGYPETPPGNDHPSLWLLDGEPAEPGVPRAQHGRPHRVTSASGGRRGRGARGGRPGAGADVPEPDTRRPRDEAAARRRADRRGPAARQGRRVRLTRRCGLSGIPDTGGKVG